MRANAVAENVPNDAVHTSMDHGVEENPSTYSQLPGGVCSSNCSKLCDCRDMYNASRSGDVKRP